METSRKSGIEITKTSATVAKYKAIMSPGIYEVEAGFSGMTYDEKLGKSKHIVNLKAVAEHKLADFKALFDNEEGKCDLADLNGLTMTANVIINTGKETAPMKNQLVKIEVGYVDNREKTAKILAVTNIEYARPKKGEDIFASESSDVNSRISASNVGETSLAPKKETVKA